MALAAILALHVNAGAEDWPKSTSCISLYAGTLGDISPVGITYEQLWHRQKIHLGISAGLLHTFYDRSGVLGFYGAGILMAGMKAHHFEARLGGSYHPVYTYPDAWSDFEDFSFMPVIALGYRYQAPGENWYFRAAVGTGGIGIGIGFVLGHGKNTSTEQ
jgi:hypothetical protein